MRKLFVAVMILTLAIPIPALAQDSGGAPAGAADQYDEPPVSEAAGEAVVAEGTVQKQGMTAYQYGTHVLTGENGNLLFALQSDTVTLDDYVGKRVTLHGIRVSGYQNGAVEGDPDLLEVTRIDDGSPTQPPAGKPGTNSPDTDTPETGDSGEYRSGSKDTAATGVLSDTGGIPVAPLLTINAVLIGSALLVRRIVG